MNYWFLYRKHDGTIYGCPYLGSAESWKNVPNGCSIIGPFEQSSASDYVVDAFNNPNDYIIKDGTLVRR